ncbi:MAG TPA: hypothetical protein VFL14_06040 [Xanthomonadales bacterium]|nr:hypothetical protein [Xanthomonadales bacterium]
MRTALLLTLLLAATARGDEIAVTLRDAGLLELVNCPTATGNVRFSAPGADAIGFVRSATRGDGRALARDDVAFTGSAWHAGECARFTIDATAIAARRDEDFGYALAGDLLLSPHTFLWRADGERARVRFAGDDGFAASAPWQPLDAFPHVRYEVRDTPRHWPAVVALGKFGARDVVAGRGVLRVALPGVRDAAQRDVLLRFAGEVANDVAKTFPGVFAASPQLLVLPTGRRGRAVTFGQSLRGGGTGIMLYVDPSQPLAEYHDDWTLTHELVHLVHPYLGDDGRWIGEGVATYYQNVIRARSGRITPRRAWRELDAGFARGRANASTMTLTDTSRDMDNGYYMRAYWAGTAIALSGDVALRTRTQPATLDAAIAGVLSCCRERGRRNARRWLAALDAQVGGAALATSYDAVADGTAFPDVAAAYAALGLTHRGSELVFSDAPTAVALRTAIMGADN